MSVHPPASHFDESRLLDWLQRLPSFEEALARLLYIVEHRRPCGLVLGPAGTGKSALLDVLFRKLTAVDCQPLLIDLQTMGGAELPWALASGLGLAPTETIRNESLWRLIEDRFEGAAMARQSFVPLIDHLDQGGPQAVAGFNRCMHLLLQFGGTVVLSARPPLSASMADLVGPICDLRIELPVWTLEETRSFVANVLQDSQQLRISPDFSAALHRRSGGCMREIVQILRLAIFAAEMETIDTIDAALLQTVAQELWRPEDAVRASSTSGVSPAVQLATTDG